MASSGVWTASSSVGNATCSWPQEAVNSSTESFKPISKWRILRSVFNCTRIWRDVGRQAQNLRVRYTLDLQFRSIEVNQDLATSKPSATDPTQLPMNMSSAIVSDSFEDTKQRDTARHGCKKSCNFQDLIFCGQVLKPCMVFSPQPNCTKQPALAVVAFAVVVLSLECHQHPTDHVDWGGLGRSYLLGTPLESKNTCVSIVTLFQAASILLFQAAYFWLKFREASSSGRKRKLADLQGHVGCGEGVHQSLGVYTRSIKDRDGNVVRYKYEPRFKPPREKNGRTVQIFQNLSLGGYNNRRDAEIVRQIAAFYYDMDKDLVSLGEGRSFRIPAMNPHGLSGLEKAKLVSEKAKQVFELFCKPNITLTTECPQSGNQCSSSLHTSFPTSSLNHEFPETVTSSVPLTGQSADGLPDTSSTGIRPVSVVPCDTISHSRDGANNFAEPLSEKSLVKASLAEDNLACVSNPRSDGQLNTEVDLRAPNEKHNISGLAIQHTGVSGELNNMVVGKEGETIQVADPSTSRSLNFNQSVTQITGLKNVAERLNTMRDIRDFLLEDLDDFVPGNTVLRQSEGAMGPEYYQLQPHFLANQAPDCSTPCNTTLHGRSLSQFEPAGQCLPHGIQFGSSEGGAATSCKWGLDALTSEGAPVHNSHYSEVPTRPMLSPQQGSNTVAPALAKVTPSPITNFCSENCIADLLLKVVSLQRQQIEELKSENECLQRSSGLKCSFCCSQPY